MLDGMSVHDNTVPHAMTRHALVIKLVKPQCSQRACQNEIQSPGSPMKKDEESNKKTAHDGNLHTFYMKPFVNPTIACATSLDQLEADCFWALLQSQGSRGKGCSFLTTASFAQHF